MRPSIIVISMGMLAACGGLAYIHVSRNEPAAAVNTPTAPASHNDSSTTRPAQATNAPDTINASVDTTAAASSSRVTDLRATASTPKPGTVEQWIKDTRDSDPKIRAAAIAKLANAPTAQALPALREVVDTGEAEVDRHIALRSLHALALRDGDSNGQVRDVMRRAIYHGDNDGVTQTAQSLLDDVEAAFAEQQQKSD